MLIAVITNIFNNFYDVLLAMTVATMMIGSVAWAVLPSKGHGALGRGAGQGHLILFTAGVALKVLDDSKILCVGWARDSPLQLTGALHVLTGISSMLSDMHTQSQLDFDAEEKDSM